MEILNKWMSFDFDNLESFPLDAGKYFVCRKDGKLHWETFDGMKWEYNQNEIKFWAKIILYPSIVGSMPEMEALSSWVAFDFYNFENRPSEYGKYFVCGTNGKGDWETWNGSGWAYNHNKIKSWAKIIHPSVHGIVPFMNF